MAKYKVKPGDSWERIAGKYYGDQRQFLKLMQANPKIRGLHPGMEIKIPWLGKKGKVDKAFIPDDVMSALKGKARFSFEDASRGRIQKRSGGVPTAAATAAGDSGVGFIDFDDPGLVINGYYAVGAIFNNIVEK